MKTLMYYLALFLGLPFALIFFKMKITYEGKEKFKIPKGAIIISPHKSFLDAIAIAYLFFFRRLYFLAADWYHNLLIIFKPFMLLLGAILVDPQGRNLEFIEKSKKVLMKNKSILVFPEGDYLYNKKLYEFGEFKPGYLMMANSSGAPIVPIILDFSYGIFSRLHIKIGKPIYISSNDNDYVNSNNLIYKKCLNLFYELKKEKATKIKMTYTYKELEKGDVIRVKHNLYHHYGIYFDDEHVLEFGNGKIKDSNDNDVHFTSLGNFTNGKAPEVRIVSKRHKRSLKKIIDYEKEIIGQKDYSIINNNCLDLVNRLTLKI